MWWCSPCFRVLLQSWQQYFGSRLFPASSTPQECLMIFVSLFLVRAVICWWTHWWAVHLEKMKTSKHLNHEVLFERRLQGELLIEEIAFQERVVEKACLRLSLWLKCCSKLSNVWKTGVQFPSMASYTQRAKCMEAGAEGLWSQYVPQERLWTAVYSSSS